jgi:hypothetical protein
MIPYKKYRQDCIFRDNKICTYWEDEEKPTQCHLLSCPLYSNALSPKRRQALEKKIQDKIIFQPSDFDKGGTSVKDIIQSAQNDIAHNLDRPQDQFERSVVTEKTVTRLICLACGEYIDDDKFVTIRDPHGVIIYLHSKGKCDRRHDQLEDVRERWLSMREQANDDSDLEAEE